MEFKWSSKIKQKTIESYPGLCTHNVEISFSYRFQILCCMSFGNRSVLLLLYVHIKNKKCFFHIFIKICVSCVPSKPNSLAGKLFILHSLLHSQVLLKNILHKDMCAINFSVGISWIETKQTQNEKIQHCSK